MTESNDERVEAEEVAVKSADESTRSAPSTESGEDTVENPAQDAPAAEQSVKEASPKSAGESDTESASERGSDRPDDTEPDATAEEGATGVDPVEQAVSDPASPSRESPRRASDAGESSSSAGKGKTGDAAAVAEATPPTPPRPERPEITALREARKLRREVEGQVIGWNNGGLHVVVDGVTAFCPRSEVELGAPKVLESYLDQKMHFHVLRVQKRGRRVVLSRRGILQAELDEKLGELRTAMQKGEILEGKVSSITDFGAFVDLGGVDGLVHISEVSRNRVEHARDVVAEGDTVKVRVLRITEDGRRISLSMKALEPDPWDGLEDRFQAGSIVQGTVEKVANFGAFIEIAPGITGLLPTSAMNLPREAQPARVYGPGKDISVQILSIDRKRRRISLSLEGSQVEATRADLKSYLDQQKSSDESFGALAAAFDRAKRQQDT